MSSGIHRNISTIVNEEEHVLIRCGHFMCVNRPFFDDNLLPLHQMRIHERRSIFINNDVILSLQLFQAIGIITFPRRNFPSG